MAQRGVNKVTILGNLGQDPEVRFMPSGDAVANLTLATSETWKDKQTGEQKEKTEWHRVVIFGKLAEIAGEFLKKGSKIYIEGKLQTRKWQNQQGVDQYTTEIVLQGYEGVMQMLDSRQQEQQPATAQGGYQKAPLSTEAQAQFAAQQQLHKQAPAQQYQQQGGQQQDDPIPF